MGYTPLKLKFSPGLAMNIGKGDIRRIFYDKTGVKEVYAEKKYCPCKILKAGFYAFLKHLLESKRNILCYRIQRVFDSRLKV